MREAITPHERLTATLRFLAAGWTYEDLKWSTIISPQVLSYIVSETCRAIWYICNSDLPKSLLLLHTFSYTCACRTCASIQYRNSNIFMSLVLSKYLCNIIIHTLMYTCTINLYMHTGQVCSYVCSRPKIWNMRNGYTFGQSPVMAHAQTFVWAA
jgi:hypothetical protein